MSSHDQERLRVVIAGGGVAGIEAALALRELAGDRVAITMLTPEPEFVYRPMRVVEPFAGGAARHYPLDAIAGDVGFALVQDTFKWLDSDRRSVHTVAGEQLPYDALLLALGARPARRFRHAITLDDRQLDEQLHGLVQDVEGGYARKIAFIAPSQMPWPLPLYELALMTARRAWDVQEKVEITLVTSEAAPLAIFGSAVSDVVGELLAGQGIEVITSAHCETPRPGEVSIEPGKRRLRAARVVALPELYGPSTPGLSKRDGRGFIPIDSHCAVPGLERVFAAGDATEFPVKHGGIASQQADVAAEAIAAMAGAPITPGKFQPVIQGILLGGEHPLYLSAQITGGRGTNSKVTHEPSAAVRSKIAAKYLAPYLDLRIPAALR